MVFVGVIIFAIGLFIVNTQLEPSTDNDIDHQLTQSTLSTMLFGSIIAVVGFITAVVSTLIRVLS